MKNKKIIVKDIGRTEFSYSWRYQESIFDKIIAQKVKNRVSKKKSNNLLLNKNQLKEKKIDFYKINRGGDITYHGPGQIMGYPILDLDNFFTDINLYLRNLENTIIDTLKHYEIEGFTIKGETGVWVKKDNDYKNLLPPLSLLDDNNKIELINKLNEIDFKIESTRII